MVLLQVHGSSEERGGAAEETESAGSPVLHSLRYTHTHTLCLPGLSQTHVAFLTMLLLDRLNAVKHNTAMIFGHSHG